MNEDSRPGPKPQVDDCELLALIRQIMNQAFWPPTVRSVHGSLQKRGITASIARVNRGMREAGLLAAQNTLLISLTRQSKSGRHFTKMKALMRRINRTFDGL